MKIQPTKTFRIQEMAGPRRKFIAFSTFEKKKKENKSLTSSQISKLMIHLKLLVKQGQVNPQKSQKRREKIHINKIIDVKEDITINNNEIQLSRNTSKTYVLINWKF
jgi:hypothetical protein